MGKIRSNTTAATSDLEMPESADAGADLGQAVAEARRVALARSMWMHGLGQRNGLLAFDALRQRAPHCPKTLAGYVRSFSSLQR